MSARPHVLEELGAELERVAQDVLAERRRLRVAPHRLSALAVCAVMLVLAAAAAAAVLLIRQGAPLPAAHVQDLQAGGVPVAGSARLAHLDAPDPEGGAPPWDIRLSRTRGGETCTAVGQVLDGHFGILGLDHVFRVLPLGGVDACGVDSPSGPVLAGARVFLGATAQDARTVVNGVVGPGARSVTVYGPDGTRGLRLGPHGSFITVYRGYVEEVRPRVVVVTRDGKRHSVAFAQSAAFEVPDPAGRSAWQVSGSAHLEAGAYPDENCAQASQEVGRTNPDRFETPLTPEVCGRLSRQPLFVAMRRFVPGSGEHTGFPWGNSPARTLVYGAAALRVSSLTLTGAGPARKLTIDAHGGVFLAVLDGHVDPRALRLTARLRDGRTLTYARSTNLLDYRSNHFVREAPVPAYRNPLPARQAEPPAPDIPIASTARMRLRAKDPAGGPEWALRSWEGRPNPQANFGAGYHPAHFLCRQVGVVEHGRLAELRAGFAPLALALGKEYGLAGGCDAPGDLTRLGPWVEAVSYVDDPYAYAPRPLRTVVSGLLRLDARNPVLLGAGAPRPLQLDANHAFLAVLPGRYWDAPLRLSATVKGRTIGGRAGPSFPGPPGPSTPQARAPDPGGGAPWGFAAGADGSSAYGRILQGRFAVIEVDSGALLSGPLGWSSGGNVPIPGKRPPVRFDTQGGPEPSFPELRTSTPSRPQLERRTLPGHTIVTGIADADVVSVTLATPRDVRTLRPSGPEHVFIVAYDGQFFRGAITATVKLRDGRSVTESVPNGPGGGPPSPPQEPSLSARLREVRHQLTQQRGHAHRLPRFAPRMPSLAASGHVIERRIAYIKAHPDVLPNE